MRASWRNAPTVNMERAKRRQAYALQRMAEEGYITRQEADEAGKRAIVLTTARTMPAVTTSAKS